MLGYLNNFAELKIRDMVNYRYKAKQENYLMKFPKHSTCCILMRPKATTLLQKFNWIGPNWLLFLLACCIQAQIFVRCNK